MRNKEPKIDSKPFEFPKSEVPELSRFISFNPEAPSSSADTGKPVFPFGASTEKKEPELTFNFGKMEKEISEISESTKKDEPFVFGTRK